MARKLWNENESEENPNLARICEANVPGRNCKHTSRRLVNPFESDHCKSEWEKNAEKDFVVKNFRHHTVRFRRRYAYVYALMSRPCGVILDGVLFADSESPTLVAR